MSLKMLLKIIGNVTIR